MSPRLPVAWPPLAVLALGVALRFALALVNRQANDDHLSVIHAIAFEGRVPGRLDAAEGFQPKLYHATVAALWRPLRTESPDLLIQVAQLVSAVAGALTVIVVARWLARAPLTERTRLVALALVALNPKLIGISAQATNDAFVILFGALTLAYGARLFTAWQRRDLVAVTAAACLAALAKGNGLVAAAAVVVIFGAALVARRAALPVPRWRVAVYAGVFALSFLAVVLSLGPYATHYRQFGSPLTINMERPAPPRLVEPSYTLRPGVVSVADALLTFRLVSLLREPMVTNSALDYPAHRTSLWSQLYGRAHFVHFDAWPPSWADRSPFIVTLGRLILLLALIPTALLVAGLAQGAAALARAAWGDALLTVAAFGYLAFAVVFALTYRDFSTMKAIFLTPGLLGFLAHFGRACDLWHAWAARWPGLARATDTALVALATLYVVDIVYLIRQLM